MKLATTLSLVCIILGLGIFQDLQAQTKTRYDLQFVEVSNSGTTLDVKVQIRNAGADFQLFDANLVFTCAPAANFGAPELLRRFENFDNQSSTHYKGMTVTTPFTGMVSLNIAHSDAPYTTVTSSWMDVAVVRLPIASASGAYSLTWSRTASTSNVVLPGSCVLYQYNGANARVSLVPGGTFTDLKGSLNPFNLLDFTARLNGRQVLLNWTMGADAKVATFDVERSSANNSTWTKIGTVPAVSVRASAAGQTYAFTDNDITGSNTLLYRLNMTDASRSSKYSSTVRVQVNVAVGRPQLLASFPNPFNPMTSVRFSVPGDVAVTVTIFDAAGKEITRLVNNEILEAGEYTKTFNGSELASGKYLLRMVAGDYVATENLILNK